MKKLVLFVAGLLLSASACKNQVTLTDAKPSVASQGLVKAGGPVEPANDPNISIDDPEFEITPATKLYFPGITREQFRSGNFEEFLDRTCRRNFAQNPENPVTMELDKFDLAADAIVLVRQNSIESHQYCEGGKLQKYNDYNIMNLDVLHVFHGSLSKGNLNVITGSRPAFKRGDTRLFTLFKTNYGDYYASVKFPFSFKEKSFISHPTSLGDRPPCYIRDIPSKVGDIDEYFKNIDTYRRYDDPNAGNSFGNKNADYSFKKLTLPYGNPGDPCDIEQDRKKEEEADDEWMRRRMERKKIINEYTRGKKAPCASCPSGYTIEDLTVDEYLEKLAEIEAILAEKEKNNETK